MSRTSTTPTTYTAAMATGEVEDLTAAELADVLRAARDSFAVLRQRHPRRNVSTVHHISTFTWEDGSESLALAYDRHNRRGGRDRFASECVSSFSAGADRDVIFDLYNAGRLVRLAPRKDRR